MNDRMNLSDLDADDARTAAALHAAFSAVTLDRPSPAIAGPGDAETAAALDAAFSAVTFDRPTPGASTTQASLVALPSHPRKRSTRWLAAAAAAIVGLTLAITLAPGRASVAWATEPTTPTTTDTLTAQKSCSAPLSRGLGDLQQSATASVTGTVPRPVEAPAPDPGQPTTLPPLVVLDIRGDGALAVYRDATWQVICLLKRENGTWVDQGISVGPGASTASPGLVFSGGTAWVGGDSVSYLGGTVPAGTSRVTFRLSDGATVQASVLGTTFAAWFPGDRSIVPGSLASYDGHSWTPM